MTKALRILIADDHDLMRRGIKGMLQSHPGWEICGEAHTGREAVTKAQELKPDIAILDISMPDLNGVDAARRIRRVTEHGDTDFVRTLLGPADSRYFGGWGAWLHCEVRL